jgi:hypothetical protein
LLFLLWLIQSISLNGCSTLLLYCLRLLPLRLRMPVELVRGGMAFGDAKGCEVEGAGMVVDSKHAGSVRYMWRHSPKCLPGRREAEEV